MLLSVERGVHELKRGPVVSEVLAKLTTLTAFTSSGYFALSEGQLCLRCVACENGMRRSQWPACFVFGSLHRSYCPFNRTA